MTLNALVELLKTAETIEPIDQKREEIRELIPAIGVMFDFDQRNHYHQYDLWRHCLHTAINLPRNLDNDMLYLAAMLHDIGKPSMQTAGTEPGDTDMHYRGHPSKSHEIVRDTVLPQLEQGGVTLSKADKERLRYYVKYHDDPVLLDANPLKKHAKLVPFAEFQKLMLLQIADATAHVQLPLITNRLNACKALAAEEGERRYRELQGLL